ncbi:MAG TPA: hypothetical protein VN372_10925 [Methanospirillum sp.]|nr:hypothetical protein [Methanospirillum sp.]
MSESFLDTIPTLDKHLDSFFDRNADGIIEEWGLVTSNDIRRLRMKLDFLSYEVNRLVIEKSNLEKRTLDLRKTIKELEESR